MNVKKFTAETMDRALAKVKSDLGRDAVILHTRCYRTGGFLGLGSKRLVEVTASDRLGVAPRRTRPSSATPIERAYRPRRGASADLAELRDDIGGLRTMVRDLVRQTRPARSDLWPEALQAWYRKLTDRGAAPETVIEALEPVAARLVGTENPDPAHVRRLVLERLSEALETSAPPRAGEPGAPKVIALVGPTGVGKTTTIAKLAAHFCLKEQENVGLLTLDTYRIAAVEQLRTYARIVNVPLEVVLSPSDLPEALERLRECSLVFVDTAGRSQRDSMKMNDLCTFFESRRPDQVHLVLSATAGPRLAGDVVEKFGVFEPDRVLLTKLDEMPACGGLLDIARAASRPLSYLTTGQDVPDDIEPARADRLAALIAGEVDLDG